MTHKPTLRNWADVTAEDFRRHAFWVDCDIYDQKQPWFEELGAPETTIRAWSDGYPIRRKVCGYASATFTLATGLVWPGYIEWLGHGDDRIPQLRYFPSVFIGERAALLFWYGAVRHFGLDEVREAQEALCHAAGAAWDDIFPIAVDVPQSTFDKKVTFTLDGFGGYVADDVEVVWRERIY